MRSMEWRSKLPMLWSSLGVKWQKNLLPLSAGAVNLFLWEGRLRIDTGVVVEGGVPGRPSHGEVALITVLRPWGLTVYRQLAGEYLEEMLQQQSSLWEVKRSPTDSVNREN